MSVAVGVDRYKDSINSAGTIYPLNNCSAQFCISPFAFCIQKAPQSKSDDFASFRSANGHPFVSLR